jgi:hypothetical protein
MIPSKGFDFKKKRRTNYKTNKAIISWITFNSSKERDLQAASEPNFISWNLKDI